MVAVVADLVRLVIDIVVRLNKIVVLVDGWHDAGEGGGRQDDRVRDHFSPGINP